MRMITRRTSAVVAILVLSIAAVRAQESLRIIPFMSGDRVLVSFELNDAYSEAVHEVRQGDNPPVPLHIRNAPTRLMQDLGYGRGYQYAHDFDEQTAPMDCLPEALSGRRFYEPKDAGLEAEIRKRLEKMRAARSLSVSDPHQD